MDDDAVLVIIRLSNGSLSNSLLALAISTLASSGNSWTLPRDARCDEKATYPVEYTDVVELLIFALLFDEAR